jgi:hypothetical protein
MIVDDAELRDGITDWDDPIVAEVRRVREELFARFNYDLRAYFEFLQKQTAEAVRSGEPLFRSTQDHDSPTTAPVKRAG